MANIHVRQGYKSTDGKVAYSWTGIFLLPPGACDRELSSSYTCRAALPLPSPHQDRGIDVVVTAAQQRRERESM